MSDQRLGAFIPWVIVGLALGALINHRDPTVPLLTLIALGVWQR